MHAQRHERVAQQRGAKEADVLHDHPQRPAGARGQIMDHVFRFLSSSARLATWSTIHAVLPLSTCACGSRGGPASGRRRRGAGRRRRRWRRRRALAGRRQAQLQPAGRADEPVPKGRVRGAGAGLWQRAAVPRRRVARRGGGAGGAQPPCAARAARRFSTAGKGPKPASEKKGMQGRRCLRTRPPAVEPNAAQRPRAAAAAAARTAGVLRPGQHKVGRLQAEAAAGGAVLPTAPAHPK